MIVDTPTAPLAGLLEELASAYAAAAAIHAAIAKQYGKKTVQKRLHRYSAVKAKTAAKGFAMTAKHMANGSTE